MDAVPFDYDFWVTRYPEFLNTVPKDVGEAYFAEAGLYLPNSASSPVKDLTRRSTLLHLLAAHIAALNAADGPGVVGRITSATEGSVSVSAEMTVPSGADWFYQTRHGIAYWQATGFLRQARYIPGRQPVFDRPYGWRQPWR